MHPELVEIGEMNPGRWRHIVETYASIGLLPADYPLDGFLYNYRENSIATYSMPAWRSHCCLS